MNEDPEQEEPVDLLPYTPDTADETARKRGLAFGASAFLVASVVVMLFIGWQSDRYFGTAPWLLVAGIFLGAIIGFYQFFRLTSQIIRKN